MQYYHLNNRVKRSASTQRILMLVNVALFVGFVVVLVLPFTQ